MSQVKTFKSLKLLKQKISKKLQVGVSRIRLKPKGLEQLKKSGESTTHSGRLVQKLACEEFIRLIEKKTRRYKIYPVSKKNLKSFLQSRVKANVQSKTFKRNSVKQKTQKFKFKNYQSLKYCMRRKVLTKKDLWISNVRALRNILKAQKKNPAIKYQLQRSRIKGGFYSRPEQLIKKIQSLKGKE